MTRNIFITTTLLLCAALLVSNCGDSTRKKLGLGRQAPDEFDVAKQAPLELPPDYELRPPQPGAERPQEQKASEQAREKLIGKAQGTQRGDLTRGEATLLDKAGADKANPKIRRIVNRETARLDSDNRPVVDRLFNWGNTIEPATLVDAPAEMKRLKKNNNKDRPVTAGETPKIEQ
jgi:hypothetical protein